MARPICLTFDRHEAARAFSRARAKTGNRIAARIAIIAMTTKSSIKVKPDFFIVLFMALLFNAKTPEENRGRCYYATARGALNRKRAPEYSGALFRLVLRCRANYGVGLKVGLLPDMLPG